MKSLHSMMEVLRELLYDDPRTFELWALMKSLHFMMEVLRDI
jgi:hypothetical protein